MSKLLINEPPLQVLPSLAAKVGLNESIFIQQLHYWLQKSKNEQDGKHWVYNSVTDWESQFPFWSHNTIKRVIKSCFDKGLIEKGCFNKSKMDKTCWYTINYESELMHSTKVSPPLAQSEPIERPKVSPPIPETTQETTTENTKTPPTPSAEADRESFQEFESFYNLHPNKGAKQAAFKYFKKLSGVRREKVKRYCERNRTCEKWREGFAPYIRTIISEKEYLDPEDEWPINKKTNNPSKPTNPANEKKAWNR